MATFIPADERKKRALARTSTPSGGYRLAGKPDLAPPSRTSAKIQGKQSAAAMTERLATEEATGEIKRGVPKTKRAVKSLFGTRDYSQGD